MTKEGASEFLKAFSLASVVFGCCFLLIWTFSLQGDRYQQTATDRSYGYASQAKAEIANRCRILAPAEQEECESEAKQTARANQRDEQDLAAQKVTAWWTRIMGGAAVFGAVLSAIGVMLVFTTFRETRRAAETASKQLDLARIEQRHSLRPYLFVDRLELVDRRSLETEGTDEDGEPVPGMLSGKIVVYLRNFGMVPARKITVYMKQYLGRRYSGRFWQYSFSTIRVPICAPSHERRVFGSLLIPPHLRDDFDIGVISRFIRLRFTYEDDTGQKFTEKAAFVLDGDDLETFYLLTDVRVAEMRERARQRELDYEEGEEA